MVKAKLPWTVKVQVGAIAGVVAVLIALGAWLVPNVADFLSARLFETPKVTATLPTPSSVPPTDMPTPTPILGDWAIVVGSDKDLNGALYEVQRAEEEGYTPRIYLQGGWYCTTVGPFSTEAEAESHNITVRSKIRESARVINLNSWCPQPEQKTEAGTDYFECP